MERLRIGAVPTPVTRLAQPSHVKRPAVIMVRRFDALTGGTALLTGYGAGQGAALDCALHSSVGALRDLHSFSVGSVPRDSVGVQLGSDSRIFGVPPLPVGGTLNALALSTLTHQGQAAVASIGVELVSTSVALFGRRGKSTSKARRLWRANARCSVMRGVQLLGVCRLAASARAQARDRLVLHRVNSGVNPGLFAQRRGTLRPQIIPDFRGVEPQCVAALPAGIASHPAEGLAEGLV